MIIIASLSGGKDSAAMLLYLVEHYGPKKLIAHYQVLPEDWPETLGYNQQLCARLGVPLVAQQIVYEPVGDATGVRTLNIIDIQRESDIVPWGNGVIAGITDLAMRRRWPPSPSVRFCTSYFKVRPLNRWIIDQQRTMALGPDVIVALGERWAESPHRSKKAELWPRPKCQRRAYRVWNWLPAISWSRRQTFRRMRDWGIKPHPAYRAQGMVDWQMYDQDAEGGPRTGCRFCIYNTLSDLCHQAQIEANQPLLRQIAEVETQTGRTWWMDKSTGDIGAPPPREPMQMSLFTEKLKIDGGLE
jgi:3'-phosphoadenosine 5'-phosphosulfate sulfotransferase (PAPS reductase)/FAD synthetase